MAIVAAFAGATRWPAILLPACAGIIGLLLYRMGLTFIAIIALATISGFALGLVAGGMALRMPRAGVVRVNGMSSLTVPPDPFDASMS
jgi:hypothetical protein